MSIFSVGHTLMFIIFKNRTDNDNILEKNDDALANEDADEDSDNKEKSN